MPLVKIYLPAGLPELQKIAVGDIIHNALVTSANVPPADRFQLIFDMPPENLIVDPHYADANRSGQQIIVEITLNAGRSVEIKKNLYAAIAGDLSEKVGFRKDDIFIVLVEVARENWSFAHGLAQYA